MAIRFNVEPYYDDFETATSVDGLSPKEKYHRILFRPGIAVQTRELTQIQSMLQNQVTQMGRHFFEEGALVIPGHASVEPRLDYIKLDSLNTSDLDQLIGLTFTGGSTGLQAKVVAVAAATGSDPDTLYVKYQNSGTSSEKVFDDGETITSASFTGTTASSASTGFGSVAFIQEGIYFIEGNFVIVQSDQLILDKYETNPSYDIGLQVTESIQTSAGDTSLNDNANGAPNFAAPGAHRYQIKTQLVKQTVASTALENFILLIRIEEGIVTNKVRKTEYSVIEETLARRTFDESGNYTVRPFMINVREHTDVNTPGDEAKLAVGLEPAKAYVRGYEVETLATQYVSVDKARESTLFEAASVPMLIGNYVEITNVTGIPDIATFDKMELRDATSGGGTIIGFARARSYVYAGSNKYRLYLFDIEMNSGEIFDDVRSLKLAATPEFVADIVLSGGKAVIYEPTRNTMVFPLPFDRVRTCDSSAEGDPDDFNYVYFLNRDVGTSSVSGGQATFNTVGSNEQFEPFDDENWIMTVATGTNSGDIVTISSGNVNIQSGSESVIISGLGAHEGEDVRLIAGVKRTLVHKSKSLTTAGSPNVDLYAVTNPTSSITLGHADGYKLKGVYMSADLSTGATTSDTDVTEYYDFNTGQRDNYYDLASVSLKPNTAFAPTGQLLVEYEYFTHTGSGDFFSVDSYDNLVDSDGNAVNYEDIPSFQSRNTGQEIELRSAIDFRPRVSNAGDNFSGTGASRTVCPEPVTTFTTDVQYYLNRIDKIFIDKDGRFGVTKGIPAVEPELPEDPKDSMVLYNLFIPAYTLSTSEVGVTMVDNKRYTMRDIGKLEKRINNLEYYTSLSLLEKEAADKQIVDPSTQVARLKAGFLVDSFSSHNVGNVLSPEYRAAIDRDNRQLRPTFSEDNVRLVYNSSLSSNVQKTGDLITLPYTEVPFYFQSQASNQINVNPYDVFEWTGTLELSPSSDEWKDTTRRPDVIVDQEGVFDAMAAIIEETDALGTVWNEWQTNWSGVTDVQRRASGAGNRSGRGWGNRSFTEVTTTVTSNESRQGIETRIVPDTINTNIGDRVVEINFAPFIRSRIITFKATRLKPNTTMYAFFDGVSVANFVREEPTFILHSDNDNPVLTGKNTIGTHPVGATALTTDSKGELIGSFFIPNNETTFFKTGTRIFELVDDANNVESNVTTKATAAYNAKGLIETKENVTISTRVPLIERREVFENRITSRDFSSVENVRWYDPLAQSFMIDTTGGAFLTSIEIFFHKKAQNIPVTLQIREMNQGIPTQVVVPFSEVNLYPDSVNVVDLDQNLPDPTQATKFTFPSPVYLQENQEYCFVLLANTNEYEVWYAEIGEDNYSTGERISKQPYAGVLFKSQNASTWTPDQNKDLKFRINRAEFDITNPGQLLLENGEVAESKLIRNPFATTSGSAVVRVTHRNHGLFENVNNTPSYVTISGATSVNGIPANEINATHEVANVEMDSYTITVSTNATGTGIDGGDDVSATQNQLIDTFYPFVQQVNLPGTNSTWGVRLSSGMSLGSTTPTPYVTDSSFLPVIVNQNSTLDRVKVIASDDNEQSGRTFFLRGTLASNRDNISPVIDLERCSVYTISNRIDNPAGSATTGFNTVADYVAETASTGGSALAKYVTKTVKLAEAADGIRVFIDVNKPSQTFVDLYYKAATTEDQIDGQSWVLANPLEAIPFDDSGSYTEAEYEIDPPGVFSVFAIKIVYRSRNSARVPTCKDLRVIALSP